MELTVLVFLPAAAAVLILLLPQRYAKISKWVALAAAIAALVLSVVLFFSFEHGAGYQFVERYSWIQIAGFDIQYALGKHHRLEHLFPHLHLADQIRPIHRFDHYQN